MHAIVARRRDEFQDWLTGLVAIPSVNPRYGSAVTGEAAAQSELARRLRGAGVPVTMLDVDRDAVAAYAPGAMLSDRYDSRPNLLAHVGEGEPALLLTSHADVVGIAPDEAWTGDPFRPRIAEDRVIARGAVDAKGSLVAMAAAMAVVHELALPLRRQVLFASVVDEEAGGGGTIALLQGGVRAGAAVVGEPTRLHVCPATRGHWLVRLIVPGRSAHPGMAYEGINPVDKAYRYVAATWEIQARLDRERPHPLWRAAPVTHVCNVGAFEAGRAGQSASVPAHARVEIMIGSVGNEALDEIRGVVDAAFADVTRSDPWLRAHPPVIEWTAFRNHGAETATDTPVVRLMSRAWRDVTGIPAVVEGLSAVTDMRHLVNLGKVPTVNFGPGDMRAGHTGDEALPLDEFYTAVEVYALAAALWGTGVVA